MALKQNEYFLNECSNSTESKNILYCLANLVMEILLRRRQLPAEPAPVGSDVDGDECENAHGYVHACVRDTLVISLKSCISFISGNLKSLVLA